MKFDRQLTEDLVDKLLEGKMSKAEFLTEVERMFPLIKGGTNDSPGSQSASS